MIGFKRPAVRPRAAAWGGLTVLAGVEPFTLTAGHRLRATPCLICRQWIGGRPATVVGVAALAGEPCGCGGIAAGTFLIHASHLPVPAGTLAAALRRGVNCPRDHG